MITFITGLNKYIGKHYGVLSQVSIEQKTAVIILHTTSFA